jgi:MYXO-CTERM domain-containing protein
MSTPETNGRAPVDAPDEDDPPRDSAAIDLEDLDPDLEDDDDDLEDDGSPGIDIAFTPRQILGGFALLAALILLLRRRKRTK